MRLLERLEEFAKTCFAASLSGSRAPPSSACSLTRVVPPPAVASFLTESRKDHSGRKDHNTAASLDADQRAAVFPLHTAGEESDRHAMGKTLRQRPRLQLCQRKHHSPRKGRSASPGCSTSVSKRVILIYGEKVIDPAGHDIPGAQRKSDE